LLSGQAHARRLGTWRGGMKDHATLDKAPPGPLKHVRCFVSGLMSVCQS